MQPPASVHPVREASLAVRRSMAERYVRWSLPPMLVGALLSLGTIAFNHSAAIRYVPALFWLATLVATGLLAWRGRWLRAAAWMCAGLLLVTTMGVLLASVNSVAFVANVVILALVVPLFGPRWGFAVVAWVLLTGAAWLVLRELGHTMAVPKPLAIPSYIFGSLILVIMVVVLIAPTRMLYQALAESEQRLNDVRRARELELAAERALRATAEELERAKRLEALGRLSAGIAHDFNNMLGAVRGTTELLALALGEGDKVRATEYLTMLDDSTERAAMLTQKLLAFGRRSRFESEQVDIKRVVESIYELSRSSLGPTIRCTMDVPQDSLWVDGDQVALEQALLNLVLNARDALAGKGRIVIQARRTTLEADWCEASSFVIAPGEAVQLSVLDDGPGIPEEIRPQLFEPFFTTKPAGVGTGLGLAAVHGTVVSHRGVIDVQSQLGAGTSFHIFLPLSTRRPPGVGESRTIEMGPATLVAPPGSVVLLADDDPLVRRTVSALIRRIGFEVVSCSSAAHLLELVETTPTCVAVVTDVLMPGQSGIALAAAVAERRRNLPVVLMSGFIPGPDELPGPPAKVLRKPFGRQQLEDALAAALAQSGNTRVS